MFNNLLCNHAAMVGKNDTFRSFVITKKQDKWLRKNHKMTASALIRRLLDKEMQKPIK